MALLSTVLGLALLDSLNPTSIAMAAYLAMSGRLKALRAFVISVYATYLAVACGLSFAFGAAARGALAGTPTWLVADLQVGAGVAMFAVGASTWRRRRRPWARRELGARSASALGVIATLMDLPTALPLVLAVGFIAAAGLRTSSQLLLLVAYDLVYVAPLVAIVLLRRCSDALVPTAAGRVTSRLGTAAPALSCGVQVGVGCILGAHGIVALA